jgi:hypothetical protein
MMRMSLYPRPTSARALSIAAAGSSSRTETVPVALVAVILNDIEAALARSRQNP